MAGINTLQEVYKKRGLEWTRDFLLSELRITEKADAYRFSFELSKNKKFRFFGKNGEVPLNRIDRTVSDLYETAISKIEKLPAAIIENLPRSHRFGFNLIDEIDLTLTDITIRNHGKVTKQIHEKPVLERWASLLHVKWGDPIYKGKLESSKIESILESLQTGVSPIFELGASQKTYIIRSGEHIAKIAPPQLRISREQKSHGFDLLLLQMYESLEKIDFEAIGFKSPRPDERYLEVVSEAFNLFVNERGSEFLQMGIKKPGFLEKSGKFNAKWIRNAKTLEHIKENKDYEYLLSIFIANLRKPKKAAGLLTESFIDRYNKTIYDIDESVRNADDYEFLEFSSILVKEDSAKKEPEFSDSDSLKAVSMLQSFFALPYKDSEKDAEDITHSCNLLIINVGNFTNKVLSECERILKLTGKSFVLIHDINAGDDCNWGLNKIDGGNAAKQLVMDFPHIFECTESIRDLSLKQLIKSASPRIIQRIYTGRSCDSLVKECDTLDTISGEKLNIEFAKLAGNSDIEVSDCMDTDDYKTFKEIYPDSLQKFWHSMRSEWNSKAYI